MNDYQTIFKKVYINPFVGLLSCYYAIKFETNKELTQEQKESALNCLHIIAEDESIHKEVRAWCYNQLGLIHSNKSSFIKI